MDEKKIKEQYIDYLDFVYTKTIDEYKNKGYVFDNVNSSHKKARYSKVDMKNSTGPRAKVTRVLIEWNPEFTFDYFKSFICGKSEEHLPAFNVFTATHNLTLSQLTASERKILGLPPIKRIDERANFLREME